MEELNALSESDLPTGFDEYELDGLLQELGEIELDEDIEEFTPATSVSPEALRIEIEEIFNKPFEQGEMSSENLAILSAIDMEKNRVSRIKELMAEGMSREDAKQQFETELGSLVRDSLGLPDETEAEREFKEKYDENHGEEE